ncbi:MAG: heat-inducible transcription repressor HrcA [Clostridiales bacterium]|nr:heat-inducible transcription repressor HrcA [Clostridiales bacterium]
MKLSDRKKKILQLVVDDYISTAQPVSSKSITEKYLTNISSATVRSELAGLEEMGYLTQLHTSSGRVPSVEAYKLYVAELMDKSKLTTKELSVIKSAFKDHADNLETVVQNAVKVISDLTDYTSVGFASRSEKDKIIKIDIFRYKKNQALLLIVTENTLIRDKFISIPESMTDAQIAEASAMLAKLCAGKEFGEVMKLGEVISEEFDTYREIFDGVMTAIEDYLAAKGEKVVMEGEGKILNNPDYNDSEKVKNFLSVVTSKNKLAGLLAEDSDNIEISIKIGGAENDKEIPDDCSLVTATYSASGVKIGTYGVIGPLRMDYQKVVSVLEGVGKILEDMLTNNKE